MKTQRQKIYCLLHSEILSTSISQAFKGYKSPLSVKRAHVFVNRKIFRSVVFETDKGKFFSLPALRTIFTVLLQTVAILNVSIIFQKLFQMWLQKLKFLKSFSKCESIFRNNFTTPVRFFTTPKGIAAPR